ncbi:MAG: hypothetical protein IJH79_02295 [Lentisphaeria bacterium]|nr:hypothetical protein [Lentisphaeria bacterium]
MPKGIYQRKPRQAGLKRNVSEESRAAFRRNLAKAKFLPQSTSARRKNAGKACSVRTARLILRKMPLGADVGNEIQLSRNRKLVILDRAPVRADIIGPDGIKKEVWEQKFRQSGRVRLYGIEHEFTGVCRIVWDYEPTLENMMDEPRFEEVGE